MSAIKPPRRDSLVTIAAWFLAGGIVTAVFSGSLVRMARNADFAEVLATGLIVPTFTWAVQLLASGLLMRSPQRMLYWDNLGRICFWGSVALLPTGIINLLVAEPRWSWSAANVIVSVLIMAIDLARRCRQDRIPTAWPASFVVTICINMTLFVLSSRHWW